MKTLITALLAISITGAAFAGTYTETATQAGQIENSGNYGTGTLMYVEGGTDTFPTYGLLDFATTGVSGSVTALTLNLTGAAISSETAGTLHFYTTTATGAALTSLTYGTGAGTTNGIINSQFSNSLLDLGTASYTAQATSYGAESFTLNLGTGAQAALASEIASGDIRILVAADNAASSAIYAKFEGVQTNSTYASETPTLSITTQPAPEPISTAIVIGALGTAIAKRRKRA